MQWTSQISVAWYKSEGVFFLTSLPLFFSQEPIY